jgi:serine/threonine-protein kinase
MYPSPIPVEQLVGHTLGTYRIERLLGYGNSEVVCLAQQPTHSQPVMLTIITLPETFSPQARERFKTRFTEVASLAMKLHHPSIFPTYDFGEQWEYFYLVTPSMTTGSLARVLKQQGKLTLETTQEILRQVADGLDYLHGQGLTHGALGNTNIVLESEQKIQIAGVGLGGILTMRGLEQRPYPYSHLSSIAGTFLGDPEYIAPEVVQGAPVDARADIYALGAMLFEWLTGIPPFLGADPLRTALLHVQQPVPSLLSFRPDLPSTLDLVLQRALERRPEQRYQSASHLANAFERVLKVIEGVGKPASTSMLQFTQPQAPEQVEAARLKMHVATSSMANTGTVSAMPEQMTNSSNEEEAVDPSVWWSPDSLTALQTPSTGSLTNASTVAKKRVPPSRLPVDKGRRKVTALLAVGGGIAVGFLGVEGINLARTMMQPKQPQQMPGMQMNGNMPMGQMTPTAQSKPMQMASPTPTTKPKPTSTPMTMPGSTPMP